MTRKALLERAGEDAAALRLLGRRLWAQRSKAQAGECDRAADTLDSLAARVVELTEARLFVDMLAEVLSSAIGGGVHFAVEPEHSSVDNFFARRSEAHALSALLCGLHPIDEDGCFIHKRPISEERVAEIIAFGNNCRAALPPATEGVG